MLVGSYIKAGDTIRISARLQEARTGRIVSAERVEGPGEASLFSLVDELTRRFKSTIAALAAAAAGPLSRARARRGTKPASIADFTDITTSSIEAYRYYAEGMNFHERGLCAQAAPAARKGGRDRSELRDGATPSWRWSTTTSACSRSATSTPKRALALIDRLTTRERYYIEGFYYGLRPETCGRGIEAYKQGLALHPEHHASRHNLGLAFPDPRAVP